MWRSCAKRPRSLQSDFGRFDVAYGDVYRVGRKGSDKSWPVGGGSNDHIATPRAISFDKIEGTQQFLGRGGQTSTQIVLLTKPPQSWTVLPLGESDHREAPLRRPGHEAVQPRQDEADLLPRQREAAAEHCSEVGRLSRDELELAPTTPNNFHFLIPRSLPRCFDAPFA